MADMAKEMFVDVRLIIDGFNWLVKEKNHQKCALGTLPKISVCNTMDFQLKYGI
jgi:hypothetical protein